MAFCRSCGASDQDEKFCSECGKPTGNQTVGTKSSPTKPPAPKRESPKSTSRSSANVCPECKSADAVQRAATVIDGGNSTTQGSALSIPINGGQWTTTAFASASTSNLASRLSPYSMPRARLWPWILLFTGLIAWFGGKWAFESIFASGGYHYFGPDYGEMLLSAMALGISLAVGLIPAILLGLLMRAIGNATWLSNARANWGPRASRVYNAYYCFRDDTMFDSGNHGRPEQFVFDAFS